MLTAKCHFPSEPALSLCWCLNQMTYSYISTDSKVENKCKKFHQSGIFFYWSVLKETGTQLKKKKSVFLPWYITLFAIGKLLLASPAPKVVGVECPLAMSTSRYGAPTES